MATNESEEHNLWQRYPLAHGDVTTPVAACITGYSTKHTGQMRKRLGRNISVTDLLGIAIVLEQRARTLALKAHYIRTNVSKVEAALLEGMPMYHIVKKVFGE